MESTINQLESLKTYLQNQDINCEDDLNAIDNAILIIKKYQIVKDTLSPILLS